MKTLLGCALICPVLLFTACKPAATFDQPQPGGTEALRAFPRGIHGQYLDAEAASVLLITDSLITRKYDFEYGEHRDSIGASFRLSGDTLIHLKTGFHENVRVASDSIYRRAAGTDTLFQISAHNVLKRFKGHYFLNDRYDDNRWTVQRLSLQKGVLRIGSIASEEAIKNLRELTETAADTASTHFSPTRKQFRKFIRQDGFSDQESFQKISS